MAKEPRFKRLEFEPGTIIIEEGSEGEAAYLITKGTVDIRTGMRSDKPQTLATLGARVFSANWPCSITSLTSRPR